MLTVAPPVAARRPLDESEAGGDDVLPRLDLGGMRVPVLADTEVRVEMNEAQQPIAATIVHGGSALQILAFAAPRHSGIWDEVRAEIADSVVADGGHVDEVDAGFGPELKARVRTAVPEGQPASPGRRPNRRCASSDSTGRDGSCAASSAAPRRPTPSRPASSKRC